ncbi:hypothetical protein ACFOY4_01550 [Actinomadura syzygii]|uniref:Uncharacterized protein n=1 Tax=Actinomadura syzygii TaxID=1427538 RepID=A0A5D0TUP4_9ACTN|nr:hypothetical protein [Actinomadura syzygii]TYC08569.1 hypothetical protein FXF65_37375 [Actinomadura syzygii]
MDQCVGHPWGLAARRAAEQVGELCPQITSNQIMAKFGRFCFSRALPRALPAEEIPRWCKGEVSP